MVFSSLDRFPLFKQIVHPGSSVNFPATLSRKALSFLISTPTLRRVWQTCPLIPDPPPSPSSTPQPLNVFEPFTSKRIDMTSWVFFSAPWFFTDLHAAAELILPPSSLLVIFRFYVPVCRVTSVPRKPSNRPSGTVCFTTVSTFLDDPPPSPPCPGQASCVSRPRAPKPGVPTSPFWSSFFLSGRPCARARFVLLRSLFRVRSCTPTKQRSHDFPSFSFPLLPFLLKFPPLQLPSRDEHDRESRWTHSLAPRVQFNGGIFPFFVSIPHPHYTSPTSPYKSPLPRF